MKNFFRSLIFCLPLVFFAGCEVVPFVSPIVTGVVMWYEGEAHKYYYEEPSTLYRSTKLALKELDHPILKDETQRNGDYYILAGEGDKFKITIRKVKPHIAEVKMRINFMGNKPYAELIYKHIDNNLNTIDFDPQGHPTKIRRFLHKSQ